MMFDTFEPFKRLKKQNLIFQPARFETWIGGKMVSNGNVSAKLTAKVHLQDEFEKMIVYFDEFNLNTEITSEIIFDEFVTANDRLQLITIPNQTNVENFAIMMFKMTIGPTRQKKYFAANEPYCCNIFLTNGIISKITFSFNNPEKLIELYQ